MAAKDRQTALNRSMPAAARAMVGDAIADLIAQYNALQADMAGVLAQLNTGIVIPATLAIHGAASVLVKTTTLTVGRVDGTAFSIAAAADAPALAGTTADTKYSAYDLYSDSTGTMTWSAKTADAASEAAALALRPAVPAHKTRLGSITITNASGAPFVANTTHLDAAGITVTYYNAAVAAIFSAGLTAVQVKSLEVR